MNITIALTDAHAAAAQARVDERNARIEVDNRRLTLDHERAVLDFESVGGGAPRQPPVAPTLTPVLTVESYVQQRVSEILDNEARQLQQQEAQRFQAKWQAGTPEKRAAAFAALE